LQQDGPVRCVEGTPDACRFGELDPGAPR
jgi:hypothetical protein